MTSWLTLLTVSAILLPTPRLIAQQPDPVCIQAKKVPIPTADMPPPGSAIDLDKCDPLELQSSPSHPIDLRQTRYCAYTARDAKRADGQNMDMDHIGGNAGLTMIYADGKDVTPNLSLAIRLACEIQGEWDDGTEVAKMLDEKRKQGATRVDFDICDGSTGRQLNYLCLLRDQDRVANEISQTGKHLNAGGSNTQRAAFQRLLDARKAFLGTLPRDSGTVGIAQENMREDIDTDNQWVHTLNDFEAGKLPRYSEEEFKEADATLNAAYQDVRKNTAGCKENNYCLSPERLQQMERAWIKYRDAWVAYGALRWPTVSADSWRTWLTLAQTKNLNGVED